MQGVQDSAVGGRFDVRVMSQCDFPELLIRPAYSVAASRNQARMEEMQCHACGDRDVRISAIYPALDSPVLGMGSPPG